MDKHGDNRIWEESLDLHTSLQKPARKKYKQLELGKLMEV